ncbi:MAG TPA: ParA family protein [Caulobacteraceae bacterium]|jgi:chromosome partitioning protein
MRTIAVVARKGGSGKTTLAVHLAIAGHLRGVRTLLADADPQRSASEALKARTAPGPKRVETSGPKLFALQDMARRAGDETLVIDTPCGPEQDVGTAMTLADLVLIVVRPTFLDIAAAVRTIDTTRRLARPAQIVLNQASSTRAGREPPSVVKAMEALRFTGMPVCPHVIRTRGLLQTALATGRSAEEYGPSPAAAEIAALWRYLNLLMAEPTQLKRA